MSLLISQTPPVEPWDAQSLQARLEALTQPDESLTPQQRAVRQRLVEVATQSFARAGYRKASVAQIAREAHVGKGSVYLYFQSKEHLLVTCIAQEKMSLLPKLQQVLALPAPQQLEALVRVNAVFCMSAPLCGALMRGDDDFHALARSLRAPLMGLPEQRDDEARTYALYRVLIRALAPEASDEAVDTIRATLLATLPALAHLHTPASRGGLSVEAFARTHARLLVHGVRGQTGLTP